MIFPLSWKLKLHPTEQNRSQLRPTQKQSQNSQSSQHTTAPLHRRPPTKISQVQFKLTAMSVISPSSWQIFCWEVQALSVHWIGHIPNQGHPDYPFASPANRWASDQALATLSFILLPQLILDNQIRRWNAVIFVMKADDEHAWKRTHEIKEDVGLSVVWNIALLDDTFLFELLMHKFIQA